MLCAAAFAVPFRDDCIDCPNHYTIAHKPGAFSVPIPVRNILGELDAPRMGKETSERIDAASTARDDMRWRHTAIRDRLGNHSRIADAPAPADQHFHSLPPPILKLIRREPAAAGPRFIACRQPLFSGF